MLHISLKTEKSFIAHPWRLLCVVGLEEYSAHDWRAATSGTARSSYLARVEPVIAAVTMQTENCHDANLVISGGATGCPEVSPLETKLAPWWFAVFNVTSWSVFICANALTWDKWDMHVLYGNVDVDIHTSNHVYCISHVCRWFIVCRTDDLYHRIRETIKYSVFCTFRAFTLASYYTCNDIGNSWAC